MLQTGIVRKIIFVLSFGIAFHAKGQAPIYLHYDVRDGLPGNIVYCAEQDENGIMWFGTDKGLASFDGVRFKTYGLKDGLPDPEVLNLMLDSKNRLWISCFKKKPCYRYKGKIYTEKEDPIIEKINMTTAICDYFEEPDKGVWLIGHTNSIFLYPNGETDPKEVKLVAPGSIKGLGIIDGQFIGIEQRFLLLIKDGRPTDSLWLNPKFKDPTFQGFAFLPEHIVLSSNNYTEILHYKDDKIHVIRKLQDIGGRLYVDKGKKLWICSSNVGCLRFDHPGNPFCTPNVFMKNKKINKVFQDRDNNYWFCTSGEGTYCLPVNHSMVYNNSNGIISNNITAVTADNNKIYFGDDEANIYSIASGNVTQVLSLSKPGLNRTRQILASNDTLAVALDAGLFVAPKSAAYLVPGSSSAKYVTRLGDELFFGTSSRLSTFSLASKTVTPIFNSRTTCVALDSDNTIWAGGVDGLFASSDTFSSNWGNVYPELKSRVNCMARARNKGIWVVTIGEGLLLANTQGGKIRSVTRINDHIAKPIENIQNLFVDDKGKLWMATNTGVYGLDENYRVVHFDSNNGLSENDVNAIVVKNDTLWAGTVAGLSKIILTNKYAKTDFPSIISSVKFRDSNKDITISLLDSTPNPHQLILPPNATLVAVDISGLDFSSRGNMTYACYIRKCMPPLRWLTFDNLTTYTAAWFRCKTDSTLINTSTLSFGVNLLPGKYDIHVYAITPSGTKSALPAVISLIQKPNWYQTFWTYAVVWIVLFLLARRFLSTFLENRSLLARVSELRLQAIKSQINPHFIGNSVNAIQQFFYPPDPVNASKYIETFTRLLRTTMSISDVSFLSIAQEIRFDEDYLKLIQLRLGTRFSYQIQVQDSIKKDTPFPSMLLQPLLENATIHGLATSGTSKLEMKLESAENGYIICKIIDNGAGINYARSRKVAKHPEHKSMGIQVLESKIKTLNDLYAIHCSLVIQDIADIDQTKHGTIVTLSYNPAKIKGYPIGRGDF